MRIHILITIFLILGKFTFAQQLPRGMEKTPTYLCNALSDHYIANARSVTRWEIQAFVFTQIEKHILLLQDSVKHSFIDIPIEQLFISLNEDSLMTAFYFVIADNAKNIELVLKHFGVENPEWTATTTLGDVEPERLHHLWNLKEYCVELHSPTNFPNKRPEYDNKIILSIKKCLYPEYQCAKRTH